MVMKSGTFERDIRLEGEVVIHAKDHRRRDLDNCLKILLDSLEKAGAYEDDSQFDKLSISRGEVDPKDPRVVITIQERMI